MRVTITIEGDYTETSFQAEEPSYREAAQGLEEDPAFVARVLGRALASASRAHKLETVEIKPL